MSGREGAAVRGMESLFERARILASAIGRYFWRARWRRFQRSLWAVPALCTAGAVGLFFLTSWIDRAFGEALAPSGWAEWIELALFASGPNVAVMLLTNIAGMWATIIGISFSVTLVTIQLTATKYIAQVLPLFERNRINQVVLGTYLGTVTYAMLVARTVRVEEEGFVPYVGVNVATLLALLSILLLILFVTNVVNFVRPQFFLEQTLFDTEHALEVGQQPCPPWRATSPPDGVEPDTEPGVRCVKAPRKGMLTDVALAALGVEVQRQLRRQDAPRGRWIIRLLKSPGDAVQRDERMAQVVGPEDGAAIARIEALVAAAMELRSHTEALDNPDTGIESLAGLTIKGAVQGDLDVTFEGIDCLFSLMLPLTRLPIPATCLTLEAGDQEVYLFLPAPAPLAKLVRELTVISEVALAPSLPFRLVTEGISKRIAGTLSELLEDGDEHGAHRLLEQIGPWYQSAFFHLDWINGMHHLAGDLAEMAIAAHRHDAPSVCEAVVALIDDIQRQMESDLRVREALNDAGIRIQAARKDA